MINLEVSAAVAPVQEFLEVQVPWAPGLSVKIFDASTHSGWTDWLSQEGFDPTREYMTALARAQRRQTAANRGRRRGRGGAVPGADLAGDEAAREAAKALDTRIDNLRPGIATHLFEILAAPEGSGLENTPENRLELLKWGDNEAGEIPAAIEKDPSGGVVRRILTVQEAASAHGANPSRVELIEGGGRDKLVWKATPGRALAGLILDYATDPEAFVPEGTAEAIEALGPMPNGATVSPPDERLETGESC